MTNYISTLIAIFSLHYIMLQEVIIALIVLFGLYILYTNYYQTSPTINSNNPPMIVNYYATWCGYSKDFLSMWDRFCQELKKSHPNIVTRAIACDKQPDQCQGIEGYPTVVLYSNGRRIVFDQARTLLNLHEFIRVNQHFLR